jgi:hypothetical protein
MKNDKEELPEDSRAKKERDAKMTDSEKIIPDPTSKRNIGLHGESQRNDQKDDLDNLVIKGNETTGYGANTTAPGEEEKSGPGFGAEGSEYKGNPIRTEDEPEGNENKPG